MQPESSEKRKEMNFSLHNRCSAYHRFYFIKEVSAIVVII